MIKNSLEFDEKEFFNNLIMAFQRLRINGLLSSEEAKKIYQRYCKLVKKAGYKFKHTGFYEYKFEKIEKKEQEL